MPRTPGEIVEALARGRSPLSGEYAIDELRRNWDRSNGAATHFMDLIPIRLVTIVENTVRGVVAEAVDHGQPYTSRGLSLIAKFPGKAAAETLLAVRDQRITLGDLVSHGFSTGRLDEIIGALSAIFGDVFRDELAASRTRWSEDEGHPSSPTLLLPRAAWIDFCRLATSWCTSCRATGRMPRRIFRISFYTRPGSPRRSNGCSSVGCTESCLELNSV